MIISRAPFRISFFGGGTDYPQWYRDHGGAVISMAITKYSYITCRYLPPFFDYKFRVRYVKREETQTIGEIEHPSVRECLRFMKLKKGVDIVHHSDLPARSGLGSSSTFTVGLLHALYALKHKMPSKRELALNAIHLEQNVIKENVGSQDQTIAAFGGFNLIQFGGINEVVVDPIILTPRKITNLENYLMLFFTGFSRTASEIAGEQIERIPQNHQNLMIMQEIVIAAHKLLQGTNNDLVEFGMLLNEQWKIKKSFSSSITDTKIDEIYKRGIASGAIGGKLLGAGGGGFMLFFVKPEHHSAVKKALSPLWHVPINIDNLGSQIIYHSH